MATAEDEPPATGTFGPAGSLAEARYGHTATLRPDGRVLVGGGMGRDDAPASAEVWDPATDSIQAGDFAAYGSGRLRPIDVLVRMTRPRACPSSRAIRLLTP